MDLEGTPYLLARMATRHVATVAAIEKQVFTQPWSYANFVHEVTDNPYSEYAVLRFRPWIPTDSQSERAGEGWRRWLRSRDEDRSIIGYGGFWLMVDEAHVCTLAVRPEWRGRGLGELLLARLIERAMERDASHATLEVRRTNTTAQALYLKYGFQFCGVRKGYYLDNREDALIMTTGSFTEDAYRENFSALTASLLERLRGTYVIPPGPDAGDARNAL